MPLTVKACGWSWVANAFSAARFREFWTGEACPSVSRLVVSEINRLYRQLARLNQTLFEHTVRDPLTGIYNRRYLDTQLALELARANRQHEPLSVLMLDVDHFKLYNDRYGHQQGDACLRTVAAQLTACIKRPADFAARYGGEEFALVLPNTNQLGAAKLAEQLRLAIVALALPSQQGSVSISIGSATSEPGQTVDMHTLISVADAALYRAKRNGRNCVVAELARPSKVA